MFEIIEHTADIGLRARGASEAEMFESAALGLVSVAVDLERAEPRLAYPITASGEDRESLLVNWLSEALYYLDGERIVLCRFRVERLEPWRISGQAWGEPREAERHPPKIIVKGVTYHQLRVERDAAGNWCAEVYLDI